MMVMPCAAAADSGRSQVLSVTILMVMKLFRIAYCLLRKSNTQYAIRCLLCAQNIKVVGLAAAEEFDFNVRVEAFDFGDGGFSIRFARFLAVVNRKEFAVVQFHCF